MRTLVLAALPMALLACATQPLPSDDPAALEHELMRAFVRSDRATLNRILADDYQCEVVGVSANVQRWVACATIGHERPHGLMTEFPEARQQEQAQPFRSGRLEDLEVARDGDKATVTAMHVYRHWLPGDRGFARVSRVTDTWERRDARWVLVRRVSEPVKAEHLNVSAR